MEINDFTMDELLEEKKRLKKMIIDINKEIEILFKKNKYKIKKREEKIIRLRIIKGQTLKKVSKKFGISVERIRQIEWISIQKMDKKNFNNN